MEEGILVTLAPMDSENCQAEVAARRWVHGELQHDFSLLQSGGAPAAVARAYSAITGNTRTLSRSHGRAVVLSIPRSICDAVGFQAGSRVVLELAREDALLLRSARPEELLGYALPTLEAADKLREAARANAERKWYDRTCEQCWDLFASTSVRSRFCKLCAWRRGRACDRRWWARAGKKSPSYQRKLRPPAPAEEIPAPAGA